MSAHSDFLHLFQPSATDLRAFIGALIRDPHTREDVFQEVCRTLWEKFDSYDLDRPFGAWARGIATRKILESRRKSARFPLLFPPETVASVAEAFDQSCEETDFHEAALRRCLEELPPKSRGILTARYDEGRRCGVIARDSGMTLKAIHQTLCRLRRALRACIAGRVAREDFEPAPIPAGTTTTFPIHPEPTP